MQKYKHYHIMIEVLPPFNKAVFYQMLKMKNTLTPGFTVSFMMKLFIYTTLG